VVAVFFQHRSGGWPNAASIDELVMLARSGRAERRWRACGHAGRIDLRVVQQIGERRRLVLEVTPLGVQMP
jgi:hypothetical protein